MFSFKVFWESANPNYRLFHKTSAFNLLRIIKKNQFDLSFAWKDNERRVVDRRYPTVPNYKDYPSMDQSQEKSFNKLFFLSTARSLNNTFFRLNIAQPIYALELNGSLLSDKYEIVPVQFFTGIRGRDRSETEDRIISSKPTIPNAKRYIICVHAYIGKADELDHDVLEHISNMGIPCYIYNNQSDFLLRNKKNAELVYSKKYAHLDNYSDDIDESQLVRYNAMIDSVINLIENNNQESIDNLKKVFNVDVLDIDSTRNILKWIEDISTKVKDNKITSKISNICKKYKKSMRILSHEAIENWIENI